MRYVVFLRAINVGKHNRIRMAELRERCAAAGLAGVETYLQTGNLAFEAEGGTEDVGLQLEAVLAGMECRGADAMVLPRDELVELLAMQPFAAHEAERFRRYVTLTRQPLPEGVVETLAGRGLVAVGAYQRAVCSVVEIGAPAPPDINGLLEKLFKTRSTTRYWRVVEAMAELGG